MGAEEKKHSANPASSGHGAALLRAAGLATANGMAEEIPFRGLFLHELQLVKLPRKHLIPLN